MIKQINLRNFSLYIKQYGDFRYEKYARKIQDFTLDFPHGKRNKIILAARELDFAIEQKLLEKKQQEDILNQLSELPKDATEEKKKLEQQKEIVSANGCVLLYRSMVQMTQKLALFEMGDMVIEDIPRNHNFLVLHRLLRQHAKWDEIDPAMLGHLATFPHNQNVLYELDTIKLAEFDNITNGTDKYWCFCIDKLELYFRNRK